MGGCYTQIADTLTSLEEPLGPSLDSAAYQYLATSPSWVPEKVVVLSRGPLAITTGSSGEPSEVTPPPTARFDPGHLTSFSIASHREERPFAFRLWRARLDILVRF